MNGVMDRVKELAEEVVDLFERGCTEKGKSAWNWEGVGGPEEDELVVTREGREELRDLIRLGFEKMLKDTVVTGYHNRGRSLVWTDTKSDDSGGGG